MSHFRTPERPWVPMTTRSPLHRVDRRFGPFANVAASFQVGPDREAAVSQLFTWRGRCSHGAFHAAPRRNSHGPDEPSRGKVVRRVPGWHEACKASRRVDRRKNMTAYRHLLCPVDFSESSRRALEWSSRFSKEVGARLSVLHVVDTEFLSIGNLVAVPDAFGELRRRAEEALTALKREIDLGHADVEIVEGVPEDVLVTAANQRDVDLLVMGTHGLSGFQRLLLGSLTENVLHPALVPLLALSPWVEQQQTMGFLAPRTIVMAIDFGPESQSVLRHGIWLAEHFRAKLVALHVVSVPYVALNESSFEPLAP